VAEHNAWARRVSATEWDIRCPGCPGYDSQVGGVVGSPALTTQDQAQQLAEFHRQVYGEMGEEILR
jgi:hypothetical protein